MVKKIKHIVAISLLLNIFISTLGINIFTDTCTSMQLTDVTINIDNDSQISCSNCLTSIEETCCSSVMDDHKSCVAESGDLYATEFESNCCSNETEFVKLTFDSEYSVSKILVQTNLQVLEFLGCDFFELPYSLKQSFYKFKSGISPPYTSTYIHFICSMLE